MIDLKFSYNWNKKLDCTAFTTIRIYNHEKHYVGQLVNLFLKDKPIGTGGIVEMSVFHLANLNSFMSYLDTGYSVREAKDIIKKMYPKVDFTVTRLVMMLIVKDVKKEPKQNELFSDMITNSSGATLINQELK